MARKQTKGVNDLKKIKNKDYDDLKQQVEELNTNIKRMSGFKEELQKFVNQKISEFKVDGMTLEELSESHNAKLEDANSMVQNLTGAIDDYISERSDNWHDSDNGVATQDWLLHWQEFESSLEQIVNFDEVDVQFDVPDLEEFELPPQERE